MDNPLTLHRKAAGKGKGYGAAALKFAKENPGKRLLKGGKIITTALHAPWKLGEMGGIEYHRMTNPWNGFSRKVRGNPEKQTKYPGFNAPDPVAFKKGWAKAGTKNPARNFAGFMGSFIRNVAGPSMWQRGFVPAKNTVSKVALPAKKASWQDKMY